MTDAMQARGQSTPDKSAQNAATPKRVVRSVAELQMALADKARGQRIAQLRKRTPGLTQQRLSEKLGVGYRTVQSWESGDVMPEWDNVERLAKFFKVRPEQVIGEAPPVEPAQLDRIEAKLDQLQSVVTRAAIELELLAAAQHKSTQGRSNDAKKPRRRKGDAGS